MCSNILEFFNYIVEDIDPENIYNIDENSFPIGRNKSWHATIRKSCKNPDLVNKIHESLSQVSSPYVQMRPGLNYSSFFEGRVIVSATSFPLSNKEKPDSPTRKMLGQILFSAESD